ncbi:MAG: hypothetical protein ACHQAY_12395 [Hyphomicrobiales bacterium]
MTARAHIATSAALAFAGLLLIAALGFAVDGYGVFGTRLIPASRFPPNLRLMKHWDRVTKAIEIAERRGDQILFVGDSRSQHGLDPDAPALAGVKGYNAALAAATLAEQIAALDYTLKHEPTIKHIVWGQSFESFPFEIFPPTDYGESAFAGRGIFPGLLRHLFGADRVVSSFKALWQARHAVRAPMKRNGVVTYGGDPVEGAGIARQFDSELAGKIRELSGPLSQEAIDKAHGELAQRLRELKAAGIDVDIVIVPMHIWRLEFLRRIGIEAQSDAWKRQFAATLEGLAASPGTGKLRLFDFARPHRFVEQSPLAPLPPGERRYYLETNHFYPWLGDKVLARVFGKGEDPEAMPATEPFGQEIGQGPDSISIDSDITTASAALDRWESTHEDEVGHIRKLISR